VLVARDHDVAELAGAMRLNVAHNELGERPGT
jgi:hypothetical protein